MVPNTPRRPVRGLSLVEILVAMAATLIVIAMVVYAMTAFERDQAVRLKIADLQGTARQALELVEFDLRHASLGTSDGLVWTASDGVRVSRPAIQIFTALPSNGERAISDAKPETDALLVVESVPGSPVRTVTRDALTTSTGTIRVIDASAFSAGDFLLLGDYGDASWGRVNSRVSTGGTQEMTLVDQTVNVLPGGPVPHLGTGAAVRRARARLYYVNTRDELVRLELAVPHAPTAADILSRDVVGTGFENMQVNCELDDAVGGLARCADAATVLAAGHPIADEAIAAFGTFAEGGGPRMTSANAGSLRTVSLQVSVRSRTPLQDSRGDAPAALTGALGTPVALTAGSGTTFSPEAAFARRTYQLTAGVRNTSMGAF